MSNGAPEFDSVAECIDDIRTGKIVIVVDDEDRENEGDFTMAAEKVTPEAINFMAKYGRGLICAPVTVEDAERLRLPEMVSHNTSNYGTAFTVSVDAAHGITTGISAHDRCLTILKLSDPSSQSSDLNRPGHIFPLIAKPGGVLKRAGQTEAAVDLARLAGLRPAGVICEIMKDDGGMARVPDLVKLKKLHHVKLMSVASLISYRLRNERLVERVADTRLPTRFGEFRAIAYRSIVDGEEHVALVKGDVAQAGSVLVRVHSSCLTGDVFHSFRCDCGQQLESALQMIDRDGKGVLLYMNQEGRGIGLANKLKAYMLQEKGRDTVEANVELGFQPDQRDYGVGAQILRDLGVRQLRLLTNNMRKFIALKGYGLEVVQRMPIEMAPCDENVDYLKTKRDKLGHLLSNIEI